MNKFKIVILLLGSLLYLDNSNAQTVTDIDGNVYNTITIGQQEWMKENLKVTHFNNGDTIINVTNNSTWISLNTPAYCWYNNNYAGYGNLYGALYNWFAVDPVSNGDRNLCPTGWHVPTDSEWTQLTTYLGGENVAGGKMKETGTIHWTAPNAGATNESGFTGLPGGYRGYVSGSFSQVGNFAHWWSTTTGDSSNAWGRGLFYLDAIVNHSISIKKNGFCIRCIKNLVQHTSDDQKLESLILLLQNYPNPFNPGTRIQYFIPTSQFVSLKVYDILGNEIATLVNERKDAGGYEVEFVPPDLVTGIYFYQLQAGNYNVTKKFVFLR